MAYRALSYAQLIKLRQPQAMLYPTVSKQYEYMVWKLKEWKGEEMSKNIKTFASFVAPSFTPNHSATNWYAKRAYAHFATGTGANWS